jgi:pilus assembly protein FimV
MSRIKPPGAATGLPHSQSAEPDLEPVTASEVRTKLDLARQFIDMGDPASARHMLEEVLAEGDASQKEEAQRLIDSMP